MIITIIGLYQIPIQGGSFMARYIQIENASPEDKSKIKQDLKFRTSKFIWKVAFNTDLNPESVSNSTVTVMNMNKVPIKTNIKYNPFNKCIEIEPLESYAENESYILIVSNKVQSKTGKYLKKPIQVQFKI